jgi:serine/threonine-protein kinase
MDDDFAYRARVYARGPSWFGVIATSFVTSCCVVLGFQWAIAHGWMQMMAPPQAPAVAPVPSGNVTVPALVGLPARVAGELLEARGLRLVVREKREDAKVPRDSIIAQEPLPESTLPSRSEVSVVVSSGQPSAVSVPDLTGKTPEEARQLLEAAGLSIGRVTGPESGARVVAKSDPAAASTAARGTAVALVLEPVGVEVPKLVGLPWSKAKKLVEEAGLQLGKVRERFDDERDPYVVLQQSPEPGTRVAAGSAIEIVRNEE